MRAIVFVLLLLGGCSTDVALTYTPTANVFRNGQPAISQVVAADRRGEAPDYLGTIRGGFGNPIKRLKTTQPVSEQVSAAFVAALQARGLRREDGQGPLRIDVVVKKLDADMLLGSLGAVDMDVSMMDTRNGKLVFRDTVKEERSDIHIFAVGAFGSTDDLFRLVQTALNAAIDRTLDSAAFRSAVDRSTAISPSAPGT